MAEFKLKISNMERKCSFLTFANVGTKCSF